MPATAPQEDRRLFEAQARAALCDRRIVGISYWDVHCFGDEILVVFDEAWMREHGFEDGRAVSRPDRPPLPR